MQYTLTLTEEVEIRYRTETSTDPETGETTTEQVPYEYYILHVSLTNRDIATIAPEVLTAEQLQMFRVYLETSGNKPLLFGGGSAYTSAPEDLSGVQFVNGTRPVFLIVLILICNKYLEGFGVFSKILCLPFFPLLYLCFRYICHFIIKPCINK